MHPYAALCTLAAVLSASLSNPYFAQHGRFATGDAAGLVVVVDTETKSSKLLKMDKAEAVMDIQWDPLSDNYVLIAYRNGNIRLFDADTEKEMQAYEVQMGGISSLRWIPSNPGTTLDAKKCMTLAVLYSPVQFTFLPFHIPRTLPSCSLLTLLTPPADACPCSVCSFV